MANETRGTMIWQDARIAVRDVVKEARLDANGVRDGWAATTDNAPMLAARMFFPADMFTFEPIRSVGETNA